VPPLATPNVPPITIEPLVGTLGVKPVDPPDHNVTPEAAVDAAIEIVPAPFVIEIFAPAVNVARLKPDPLPTNN
jgi:hypothetical protein